jgi:hypothetical protein
MFLPEGVPGLFFQMRNDRIITEIQSFLWLTAEKLRVEKLFS